jgi:hypothetical protein
MSPESEKRQFLIWPIGRKDSFRTTDPTEARIYLKQQLSAWEAMRDVLAVKVGSTHFPEYQCAKVSRYLTHVDSILNRPQSTAANNSTIDFLNSESRHPNNVWVDPESEFGERIRTILTHGDPNTVNSHVRAALRARGFKIETTSEEDDLDKSVLDASATEHAFLAHERVDAKIKSTQKTLDTLEGSYQDLIAQMAAVSDEIGKRQRALTSHIEGVASESLQKIVTEREVLTSMLERDEKRQSELGQKIDEILVASRSEIDAFKAEFQEKIRLGEPSRYWKLKTRTHLVIATFALIVFLAAITQILWMAFENFEFLWALISELQINSNGGFSVFGVAAISIPTVLVFWILKHVSRVFIDNAAFAADASQRKVMMETYLALVGDPNSKVTDSERILVLHALFRPTSSVSADDGPPSGLWEIVNKAVEQRKS